jgi:uncharacterized protein YqeY
MLRDDINNAMKSAMRAQEKLRLSALRMVNAAIQNADIEARTAGRAALSDAELLSLLQKLIKQRQEAAELYDKGGRPELASQERGEIDVLAGFLPQQMNDLEMREAIAAAIKESGAASLKDMGKVMALLKQEYSGRMDFSKASGLVKAMLAG